MEDNYDVIVIGGGLGGLTAGAKLAKEGKKVLLIEQHYIVGGCATVFKRKGFTFEVGLHEMDGLHEDDLKTKIFKELGVFENVEFIKVPEFYRFKNERVDIVLPHDTEEAIKELIKHFPLEEKGIRKYFKTIHSIYDEIYKLPEEKWKLVWMGPLLPLIFPNLLFYLNQNLGNFLDSIIKDEDLKLALVGNLGYYSDNPYSMSLIYYSYGQSSYHRGGGHYIKGGSQNLSDYLASFIRNNGGKVLLKHLVTEIIIENGKAVGIQFKKTNNKEEVFERAYSKTIILNGSLPTLGQLLPSTEKQLINSSINNLEVSCSLISVFIGFKTNIKKLKDSCYSTFFNDVSVTKLGDVAKNGRASFSTRGFVFVDYSQFSAGLCQDAKSVASICTVDYLSDWEDLSEEEYTRKKEEVAVSFFNRLEKQYPGISEQIEYYEVGTPRTIQRYTLNYKGSPYGYAQLPSQAGLLRTPNKSPIKNLYYASSWAYPGHGFSGAIFSGWFCANEIIRSTGRGSKIILDNKKYSINSLKNLALERIKETV